jgi:hypothetical protein
MIILTIYRYQRQALPEDLYERLRDGRQWMPANGLYDWYERNARYYWTDETLREAKRLAFGLEFACIYRIEDTAQAHQLYKKMLNKENGVQKTVPGAIALQVVRHFDNGQQIKERYQWGQLAYPSRAHRWCKVPVFSGTATEEEGIEVMK